MPNADTAQGVLTSSKRLLPWLVAVAFFMESLDTTILNTAVPAIAEALQRCSAQHEVGAGQLHLEPRGIYSHQRLDGGPFRNAAGVCLRHRPVHLGSLLCGISTSIHMLVACRILQGCGGAMMVPVGRLTLVRTFAKSELVRAMSFVAIPGLIGPMLGPVAGGLIVGYFHWRVIFFVNIPDRPGGFVHGLPALAGLPRRAHRSARSGRAHSVRLRHRVAVVRAGGVRRTYAEHAARFWACWRFPPCCSQATDFCATKTQFPLLRLSLFHIRTFRASVSGSFFTRLGIGGMPFLFPLLYQVGLGFTPIQSGLLMMPQALAAMSLKLTMPKILTRLGYRGVLISNTVILGLLIVLFATIGVGTPVWLIVLQAFCYGFFTSLQYTSMNTLVYADVTEEQTSSASTIASTMQQMSISFGVATASLATAFFIPDRFHSNAPEMIHGIHRAFLVLGAMTVLSTLIFRDLKAVTATA